MVHAWLEKRLGRGILHSVLIGTGVAVVILVISLNGVHPSQISIIPVIMCLVMGAVIGFLWAVGYKLYWWYRGRVSRP